MSAARSCDICGSPDWLTSAWDGDGKPCFLCRPCLKSLADERSQAVEPETSDVLVDSGLRYCTVHHGVVDVDESDCDFRNDAVTRCEATPLLYRGEVGS